jgi:hypothetical protein
MQSRNTEQDRLRDVGQLLSQMSLSERLLAGIETGTKSVYEIRN